MGQRKISRTDWGWGLSAVVGNVEFMLALAKLRHQARNQPVERIGPVMRRNYNRKTQD
jgi:hypothetical protein